MLPILKTSHLALRSMRLDDVDTLHALWTVPEVARYLWDGRKVTIARTRAIVVQSLEDARAHGFGLWVLEPRKGKREGAEVLGVCGLRSTANDPELLYALLPAHWGRGYATEACRAALEHAFDTLQLERVLASTDEPNAASVRVLERIGMRRADRIEQGEDVLLAYELTREGWLGSPDP